MLVAAARPAIKLRISFSNRYICLSVNPCKEQTQLTIEYSSMIEASLTGLLRTIAIIVIVIFVLRLLARIFMPVIMKSQMEKMQQHMRNQANFQQQQQQQNEKVKQEGDVTIEYIKKKKNQQSSDNDDDYVDYEVIE